MFAKRPKKEFPPGTFIAKPARILAILQLCVAFTMILYIASYPFMGALFEHKSKLLLYRTMMGDPSLASAAGTEQSLQYKERLLGNQERFENLSPEVKAPIIAQYNELLAQDNTTFFQKLGKSIHIFLFELPAFELAWILFASVISLMVLLRVEGAAQTAWLLPIIAACYAGHNIKFGITTPRSADEALFPSEEVIVKEYLRKALPDDIVGQQKELMIGWKIYLIQEWGHEQPVSDVSLFDKQAENGEFYFNLARLQAVATSPVITKSWHEKESPFLLLIYFLWNLYFAWTINRKNLKHTNEISLPPHSRKRQI